MPRDYGYTNSTDKCWIVSTNIPTDGHRVDGIMVLESSQFQGRGCLVGTESGEVYWHDGKTAKLMKSRAQ